MPKLAIIGASYLQLPLIQKAKQRGIETHVFAWRCDDVGEKEADYFYPISIIEKEQILDKCQEIRVDGICSIASDLAVITVNYVAEKMNLVGNSIACAAVSTDKHLMRQCFKKNGDPSPMSLLVKSMDDLENVCLEYPIIVKPLDRSGSRGVTMLMNSDGLEEAIENAKGQGFKKYALIEEFVHGNEYSVEFISWKGNHHYITTTKKYTSGEPNFIETAHLEPSGLDLDTERRVVKVIYHALTSLGIKNGASHSEVKISDKGEISIIEIGGRMGGDCIGSNLVKLSTGFDFVNAVIDVALGIEPKVVKNKQASAAVRFIFTKEDLEVLEELRNSNPERIIEQDVHHISSEKVKDSSSRFGYYILKADTPFELTPYLPK